jgi:hypothetical protein
VIGLFDKSVNLAFTWESPPARPALLESCAHVHVVGCEKWTSARRRGSDR